MYGLISSSHQVYITSLIVLQYRPLDLHKSRCNAVLVRSPPTEGMAPEDLYYWSAMAKASEKRVAAPT